MLNEVIEYLNVKPGGKYIDCTLGGGGHSIAIINKGGIVLSVDQDEDAIRHVEEFRIKNLELKKRNNWKIVKGNFADIEIIAKNNNFENTDGILFDLGVSSYQLNDETRGFSFNSDAELDMRMDKSQGIKASVLVNGLSRKELERIFLQFGEEKYSWKIAKEIEKVRNVLPIKTCRQLAEICERVKGKNKHTHSATKVFQALRIQINDELKNLAEGLNQSFHVLCKNGKIVVMSFHSLEDRIVKNFFKKKEEEGKIKILTKKPILANENEIKNNSRARSAKLRVAKKI